MDIPLLTSKIAEAYLTLTDRRVGTKQAKAELDDAISKTYQYEQVERLKEDLRTAKMELAKRIDDDDQLRELSNEVTVCKGVEDAAKATLSSLLVQYSAATKKRVVDVGDIMTHEIILTARIGGRAAEQLPLFGEEDRG